MRCFILLLMMGFLTSCSLLGKYYLRDSSENSFCGTLSMELKADKSAKVFISDSLVSESSYDVILRKRFRTRGLNKYSVKLLYINFDDNSILQIKDTCIWLENRIIIGDSNDKAYYLLKVPPLSLDSPAIPEFKISRRILIP